MKIIHVIRTSRNCQNYRKYFRKSDMKFEIYRFSFSVTNALTDFSNVHFDNHVVTLNC